MYRSQVVRIARTSRPTASRLSHRVPASRKYTTQPPPPSGQPAPNPKAKEGSSNGLMWVALGLAGAAGAYWYYANPDDATALKRKAEADAEEMKRKARESLDAGKARADDAYKQSQAKYDDAKAAGKDKVASARSSVDEKLHEAEERARQVSADAQAKYEDYKSSAQKKLSGARDSTENLYNEARGAADRKSSEARAEADRKAEQAKSGWFSWLGWGKSKAEEGKQDAAGKVAESAEDVRKRAEKHT